MYDSAAEDSALRVELAALRLRIDELETRLETRIAAAEAKEAADVAGLGQRWKDLTVAFHPTSRAVSNLADQQRASHYALRTELKHVAEICKLNSIALDTLIAELRRRDEELADE